MNQEDSQHCCSQEQDYTSDTVLNAGISATPKKGSYWRRMGGGSLMVSLVIHALLVIIAVFVIHTITVIRIVEPEHKFLSGGRGGGKSTVEKAGANRRQMSVRQPLSRIVSSGGSSEITLPAMRSINRNLTMSGVALMSGGGMGGGEGGLRGKGAGGPFGDGFGKGFGPGGSPGFVAMFGRTLQAKKLAVVLDVSGSMHRYLPTVVKEANKVSGGCSIILFYGCGLKETKDRDIARQKCEPARGRDFKKFWQRTFGRDITSSRKDPIPNEEVFKVFDGRKDTWYFEGTSIGYSWLALTSAKVMEADAVYWFADFRDPVDEAQLLEVQKVLKQR
jgi:hypothetical protein